LNLNSVASNFDSNSSLENSSNRNLAFTTPNRNTSGIGNNNSSSTSISADWKKPASFRIQKIVEELTETGLRAEEVEQNLKQREQELKIKDLELKKKDDDIVRLGEMVKEKDKELELKNKELLRKNQLLTQKEDELRKKNGELDWKEIDLKDKKDYILFIEKQLRELGNNSRIEVLGGTMIFPYDLIEKMTFGFAETSMIGDGAFGKVYLAQLGGISVAIKKLTETSFQATNNLRKDLKILQRYHHPRLVKLMGMTDLEDPRSPCLVYEFMQSGNLRNRLDGKDNTAPLNWIQRLKIVWESSIGIAFLHEPYPGSAEHIIHHDIKTENIMLDAYFNAHVADYGLVRHLDGTNVFTGKQVGTPGYICPAFLENATATTKVDVYSFGVVLVEILTGKKAVNPNMNPTHLGLWFKQICAVPGFDIKTILDEKMPKVPTPTEQSLTELIALANDCLNRNPALRPTMKQVSLVLGRIAQEKQKVCISCGIVSHPVVKLKCGHWVMCKECVTKATARNEPCALCGLPIRGFGGEEEPTKEFFAHQIETF